MIVRPDTLAGTTGRSRPKRSPAVLTEYSSKLSRTSRRSDFAFLAEFSVLSVAPWQTDGKERGYGGGEFK